MEITSFSLADCNDGDPCTIDYIDVTHPSGCGHRNKCDDGNSCTRDICHQGKCTYKNWCDDNNPCTNDTCIPAESEENSSKLPKCINKPKCEDDDPCTIDDCDIKTGECKNRDLCPNDDPCVINNCLLDLLDRPQCIPQPACDDGNPCTKDICDSKGHCSYKSSCEPRNPCEKVSCDPDTGFCNRDKKCQLVEELGHHTNCTLVNCNILNGNCMYSSRCAPKNGCFQSSCDPLTGDCSQISKCPPNTPCYMYSCNPLDSNPKCREFLRCIPVDTCTPAECLSSNQTCRKKSLCQEMTENDSCYTYTCLKGSCVPDDPCNDANECTEDSCDPENHGKCINKIMEEGTSCAQNQGICNINGTCLLYLSMTSAHHITGNFSSRMVNSIHEKARIYALKRRKREFETEEFDETSDDDSQWGTRIISIGAPHDPNTTSSKLTSLFLLIIMLISAILLMFLGLRANNSIRYRKLYPK